MEARSSSRVSHVPCSVLQRAGQWLHVSVQLLVLQSQSLLSCCEGRPPPPALPRSICREGPSRRAGSPALPRRNSPVVASALRPPDKLAICCCLLSVFVMQTRELVSAVGLHTEEVGQFFPYFPLGFCRL